MSTKAEHRERWGNDLAAFALDALSEREAREVERHVDDCDFCSEQLRWLSPAVDVIPASVVRRKPPPELRERLFAIVAEEAAAERATEPAPARSRHRRWLPRFDAIALRPALAGFATFLLLAAGVVGYELSNETSAGTDTTTYQASSTINTSNASGSLEVNGDHGSLHVVDLPPASRNEVYQAWVQEPAGSSGESRIHPSSVFVVPNDGSGDVSIPKGLEGAERVMVTREPKGGSKFPSENPLLTAELG